MSRMNEQCGKKVRRESEGRRNKGAKISETKRFRGMHDDVAFVVFTLRTCGAHKNAKSSNEWIKDLYVVFSVNYFSPQGTIGVAGPD